MQKNLYYYKALVEKYKGKKKLITILLIRKDDLKYITEEKKDNGSLEYFKPIIWEDFCLNFRKILDETPIVIEDNKIKDKGLLLWITQAQSFLSCVEAQVLNFNFFAIEKLIEGKPCNQVNIIEQAKRYIEYRKEKKQ